ncbi:hypothetical protein Hanom_Chr03g00187531 [Helianthus anomalus]
MKLGSGILEGIYTPGQNPDAILTHKQKILTHPFSCTKCSEVAPQTNKCPKP